MNLNMSLSLAPIVALIAGLLILIVPDSSTTSSPST